MIFIKWFPYDKRNEAIAQQFNGKCYFIHYLKQRTNYNVPIRYLMQFIKTLSILVREKPRIVFITNPPIFAVLSVYIYCIFKNCKYVIDSHSGAFHEKWGRFVFLHKYLSRKALINIVTNDHYFRIYKEWCANSIIISDVVAEYENLVLVPLEGLFNIIVINSFAEDEPLCEIIESANDFPNIHFYITGNINEADKNIIKNAKYNIHFTGFLPDTDYFNLFYSCQAAMVLTKRDNTMQQGAYEAVSLKKPMILSNWKILKDTYPVSAVFVNSEKESINIGIKKIFENYNKYRCESDYIYSIRKKIWEDKCQELDNIIKG